MKEFISQNGGIIGVVVMVALALNFLLSGISKMLEVIKDKTTTEADNKLFDIISKVSGWLQKIVDYGSANRPH